MPEWFADLDLDRADPAQRRFLTDLCDLLDRLEPTLLDVDRQRAYVDERGELIIQLVHATHRVGDLQIEVGERRSHIYGLNGHDEDYALRNGSEELWRTDAMITVAGLLNGRYQVQETKWRGHSYCTKVTDTAGVARHHVQRHLPLGLVPIPSGVLTSETFVLDYGCSAPSSSAPSGRLP